MVETPRSSSTSPTAAAGESLDPSPSGRSVFWRVRPGPTLVLAGLLLAVVALIGLPVPRKGDDPSRWRAVREVLSGSDTERPRTADELADDLARLGRDAIDELYELALGEGALGAAAHRAPGATSVRDLAILALGRMPAGAVLAHVRNRRGAAPAPAERLTAVRILGALGASDGLELVLLLVTEPDAELMRFASARDVAHAALGEILDNDRDAWPAATGLVRRLDGPALDVLLAAVGRSERSEAIEALSCALAREPEGGVAALEALGRIGGRAPWRLRSDPAPSVRARLNAPDWRVRRAAVEAIARLHDVPAYGRLVVLLDDDHKAVRSAARWGLERMTGRDAPVTPEEWWSVYDEQVGWWVRNGREVASDVQGDDTERALEGLRAIAARPLLRREAAPTLKGLLRMENESERVLATCVVAVRIEAIETVPALADALEHEEARVQLAAWHALRALTGEDLPADTATWRAFVHLGRRD